MENLFARDLVLVGLAAFVAFCSSSAGGNSDVSQCAAFLVSDVNFESLAEGEKLHWLNIINKKNYDAAKKKARSGIGFGGFDLSGGYEKFEASRVEEFRKREFDEEKNLSFHKLSVVHRKAAHETARECIRAVAGVDQGWYCALGSKVPNDVVVRCMWNPPSGVEPVQRIEAALSNNETSPFNNLKTPTPEGELAKSHTRYEEDVILTLTVGGRSSEVVIPARKKDTTQETSNEDPRCTPNNVGAFHHYIQGKHSHSGPFPWVAGLEIERLDWRDAAERAGRFSNVALLFDFWVRRINVRGTCPAVDDEKMCQETTRLRPTSGFIELDTEIFPDEPMPMKMKPGDYRRFHWCGFSYSLMVHEVCCDQSTSKVRLTVSGP